MDAGILEAVAAVAAAYEVLRGVTDVATDLLDEVFDSLDAVVASVNGLMIRDVPHYEPYFKAFQLLVKPWVRAERFNLTLEAMKTISLDTESELDTVILLISDLLVRDDVDAYERFPYDDYYISVYNKTLMTEFLYARTDLMLYKVRSKILYLTQYEERIKKIEEYVNTKGDALFLARDSFEIDNGLNWVSK